MPVEVLNATVVGREDHTSDLFVLKLRPQRKFVFEPGQYCTIGIDGIWRPYSIVSAPHEEDIELFIELVPPPDGKLTSHLYDLKVGDSIDLLPKAKGIFTFDPEYTNHVMLVTVTGVAPCVSMLRDYIHGEHDRFEHKDHRFFILHGASYHDELVYGYELSLAQCVRPFGLDVFYIPTVSRPDESRNSEWKGKGGRVNLLIEDFLVKWQKVWNLSIDDTLIYACGHPGMIEEVKKITSSGGWDFKEERFWKG